MYILPYLPYLWFSDQPLWTLNCPSRPTQILLDVLPSLKPTTPPLHLPQVVQPQECVPFPLCRPSLQTQTNLVYQTHSSSFVLFQTSHRLTTVLSHIHVSATTTAPGWDFPDLYPWMYTLMQCPILSYSIPVRPSPISQILSPLKHKQCTLN